MVNNQTKVHAFPTLEYSNVLTRGSNLPHYVLLPCACHGYSVFTQVPSLLFLSSAFIPHVFAAL